MKNNCFRKSNQMISELSFGCGGYWGLPIFKYKSAEQLVVTAAEQGITLFDTGPKYSMGNAETRLGKIIKNNKIMTNVKIATKVGATLLHNGNWIRDFSYTGIINSVKKSLIKLNVDHFFLLQLHTPNIKDFNSCEIEDALNQLKSNGLILNAGASADGETAKYLATQNFIDSIMITYNPITKNSLDTIKLAYQNNKAVLIKSPLSHNIFGENLFQIKSLKNIWYILRILKNYYPKLTQRKKYKFLNEIDGMTPYEVCIRFLLDHSEITSVVFGTCDINHLKENIAVTKLRPLTDKLIEKINSI